MTENLNLQTVESVDTQPFRKLVMTIGELPTSFVESMTYYELLAWFTNYLETVIIPTVNNNAEAVEELQENYVELTTLFNQLHDYVDNYFDNLDVQEEINNKLDAMAEAGTLQEIITQYINTTALWMFDNVGGMKLATNFTNGSFARTLGFYNKDDKGGATYKIRTKTSDDTANEMTLIALSDSTLIAELIKTNVMNVKQFGAKGDGTTDDTTAIQKAVDFNNNIFVPNGTYMINAVTHINLNNNNKLTLDNDATIKAITNDATNYAVLWLEDVVNVEISGGTIEGDRLTHTGETGEWGHCIRLYKDCDNIYIHNIQLKNSWGDGITCKITGNVKTENVHVYNARRNGYSIGQCESFASTNDIIESSNGTDPQNGIDIEPDANTEHIKNITFNNLITKNNAGIGLGIFLMQEDSTPVEITVNNMHDYGSRVAIAIAKDTTTEGSIIFTNPYLESSGDSAIRMHRCYDSNLAVKIIRPYIINCDTNGEGSQYGAGISGYVTSTEEDHPLGNVEIIEPYIKTAYATQTTAIVFRSYVSNAALEANNIKIINPIYLNGDNVYVGKNTNVYFSDEYNVTNFFTDSTYTIDLHQYHGIYTNSSQTPAARILTIPDGMDIGRKLKFRNLSSSYRLSARLPENDYIRQLADYTQGTIRLAKLGDTIEIQKIAAHEWIISDINCTPTIDPIS